MLIFVRFPQDQKAVEAQQREEDREKQRYLNLSEREKVPLVTSNLS